MRQREIERLEKVPIYICHVTYELQTGQNMAPEECPHKAGKKCKFGGKCDAVRFKLRKDDE